MLFRSIQGSKQAKAQRQAMDSATAQAERQAAEQKKLLESNKQQKKSPDAATVLYGKGMGADTSLTGATGVQDKTTLAKNTLLGG